MKECINRVVGLIYDISCDMWYIKWLCAWRMVKGDGVILKRIHEERALGVIVQDNKQPESHKLDIW